MSNGTTTTGPVITSARLLELAEAPMEGTPMVPIHQDTLRALARSLYMGERGWLEAAVAWEVCASIHRTWAKRKDALFTTRQGDYVRHAEDARKVEKLLREGE